MIQVYSLLTQTQLNLIQILIQSLKLSTLCLIKIISHYILEKLIILTLRLGIVHLLTWRLLLIIN